MTADHVGAAVRPTVIRSLAVRSAVVRSVAVRSAAIKLAAFRSAKLAPVGSARQSSLVRSAEHSI